MSRKDEEKLDSKIQELLDKFSGSREKIESYRDELEVHKNTIMSLFPKQLDHRAKFILEEKLKTVSSFYSILLNLTQELNRNTKDEIEIRRRLTQKNKDNDVDIRQVVRMLEEKGVKVESGHQSGILDNLYDEETEDIQEQNRDG